MFETQKVRRHDKFRKVLLILGREGPYFVKEHSDSNLKRDIY